MKREAVDAERDQLRQRVEALTDDALARVMVASEDELNAALKLEGKDPETRRVCLGRQYRSPHWTHERDQLRAEVEALRADADLLDWMQRQSLDDFAVGWLSMPSTTAISGAARTRAACARQDAARGNARRAQGLIPTSATYMQPTTQRRSSE